jgi:hypothetical protein
MTDKTKPAIEQVDIYPSNGAPAAATFNRGVVGPDNRFGEGTQIPDGIKQAVREQFDQRQHRYEGR